MSFRLLCAFLLILIFSAVVSESKLPAWKRWILRAELPEIDVDYELGYLPELYAYLPTPLGYLLIGWWWIPDEVKQMKLTDRYCIMKHALIIRHAKRQERIIKEYYSRH